MATSHVVAPGEYLAQIAARYGFMREATVWEAVENAPLRDRRPNPNVLAPGDVLHIPDREWREEHRQTDAVHRFVVDRRPLRLLIVVHDFDGLAIAGAACDLEIDGEAVTLQTDGNGRLEFPVPRTARAGHLRIEQLGLDLPLAIGYLDPHSEEAGWKARLVNLGYWSGISDDDLHCALQEFQCDHRLPISGRPDVATCEKLLEVHGS